MQVTMEKVTQRSVTEATKHLSASNDAASTCEGDTPSLGVAVATSHKAATVR